MRSKIIYISIFIILLLVLNSCSILGHPEYNKTAFVTNSLKNARLVEGELKINVRNIKVLTGEELRDSNKKNNIPADTPPTFKIWSADINDHQTQREVNNKSYNPVPERFLFDESNGNTILYYDYSNDLRDKDSIIISRKFAFVSYEYELMNWELNDSGIKLNEAEIAFYTRPERFLEQTAELKSIADSLISEIKGDREKITKIFSWVRGHMHYKYPPQKRGAIPALECGEGDCGQYSYLFIALARAAGVPARSRNGFYFSDEKIGYHVWTEVFLKGYGWIPVDPTDEDGLFTINGHRLVASIGNNIQLPFSPEWATFGNSEVENGCTDFMQLSTMVTSGFEADISTERILLSFSKLND